MPRRVASFVFSASILASAVLAYTPLTDQHFNYPGGIPEQVDTDPTGRGPQFGFNICNSTTENQDSNCQTALLNSIDDFCIWAPPDVNSLIQDEEAKTVAWCTKPGHGTRVMPAGTLTGVQVLKAPAYTLFTANLNQANVNINSTDTGGELDPHGDDQRGNPLGGLVYTNGFSNGNNNSYTQVIEWHNFMGSSVACFKICNPAVANSQVYCNNRFDRTGCDFVAPAAYQDGVFEVCESDNMDPVGVYTGADGAVSSFSQPPEGVDITSLPSVKTPASSQCTPYTSSALYAAAASISPSGSVTSSASGSTTTGTGSTTGTGTSTDTGSGLTTSHATGSATSSHASGTTTTSHSATTSNAALAGARVMGGSVGAMGPVVAIGAIVLASIGGVLGGL